MACPMRPAHSGLDMADIELVAGDVLLMLGRGELSKVIAWSADSQYSHAAIAVTPDELVEAATSGARTYSIEKRRKEKDHFDYIDAFRPRTVEGAELSEADREAVRRKARSLLGTPYPLDTLATLGLLVAIRGKIPQRRRARLLIRIALDYLIDDDPSHQMCSEIAYRSLAECDAIPRGNLAPIIVISEKTDTPFPHIRWLALLKELWDLKHPRRLARHFGRAALGIATASNGLQRKIDRVRKRFGIVPPPDQGGEVVPHPNPKLITPLDLTTTPSHTALGRLMGPFSGR
jgi:hypothetical protein